MTKWVKLFVSSAAGAERNADLLDYLRLAENRPYWLGNVMALYERETRMWLDKITEVSLVRTRYGAEKKLPPPESLGL